MVRKSDIISGDILTITEMSIDLVCGIEDWSYYGWDDAWDKMDNGPTVNSMDLPCVYQRGVDSRARVSRRSHSGASSRETLGHLYAPRQTLKILDGMAT